MLDQKTIEIVKSTAPVLKEHSTEIGKRFYKLLFTKVPDLYNLFNQTNQKRGIQQEALAYSVYAAGEHIDNLDAIKPVITRVTEKHRAIGIKPEQYPVVGETLLEAVKDVLGETATEEILTAWGKAYNYIADAFISIEKELYEKAKSAPGGWEGYREFVVDKKVDESDIITSFYLRPKDDEPIADYQAGQYLTTKAEIEGEKYTHIRHYSLSDAPGKDYYRISVKREDSVNGQPKGIVSNYLHQNIQVGDTLQFSVPAGDFIISPSNKPMVLLSGGIGVTPLLSMLNTTVEKEPNRDITFIHATQNSKVHAFREHLSELAKNNHRVHSYVVYDSPTEEDKQEKRYDKEGHVDLDWLKKVLPSNDVDFYLCGPLPFLQAMVRLLNQWGVPKDQIHFEVFNPVAILGD
ncbi:NO-inducible flavohemoprotein [Oceanobacillus caeni]|uniref:NO-inducible flavohemoprotein n=1 Tax=Oceanobacillus caeni TaxID=405946 RepID=UPI00195C80F4|nr:NO-inducible flavohemoprotein [Oceanobacillus caeni]MBU8791869.1 NO-inducible flavohemoprotein [Oceanobacillus caeni]MCR1835410.1 NO-inducible flavohemoprotein [Oceanobacillus caeni]MED4475252.1 NO-inducible flavohemoprotein [Oceanobacillus caeni]